MPGHPPGPPRRPARGRRSRGRGRLRSARSRGGWPRPRPSRSRRASRAGTRPPWATRGSPRRSWPGPGRASPAPLDSKASLRRSGPPRRGHHRSRTVAATHAASMTSVRVSSVSGVMRSPKVIMGAREPEPRESASVERRSERSDAGQRDQAHDRARLARSSSSTTFLISPRTTESRRFGLFGWSSVVAVIAGGGGGPRPPGDWRRRRWWRASLPLARDDQGQAPGVGARACCSRSSAIPVSPLLAPLVVFFVLAGWSEFLGVALRARGDRLPESALILCLRVSGAPGRGRARPGPGPRRPRLGVRGLAPCRPSLSASGCSAAPASSRPVPADPGIGAVFAASAPLAVNGGLALLSLRVEMLAVWALCTATGDGALP